MAQYNKYLTERKNEREEKGRDRISEIGEREGGAREGGTVREGQRERDRDRGTEREERRARERRKQKLKGLLEQQGKTEFGLEETSRFPSH